MSLLDVKHQSHALRLIQRAIRRERMPHAYIFHGPNGVGKELLARGLAELLLCERPIEKKNDMGDSMRVGCGSCEDCRLLRSGTHPDWHLIYRQLNRDHPDAEARRRKGLDIGVDVLRHFVIDKVGHTPNRGRAKVFVIREADRITIQAQNALLKTLEEPPGTTFIILLVSSIERLLATTLSRCQCVGFDALPTAFVREQLSRSRSELSSDQAGWYARLGMGSVGAAIEAVEDQLEAVNARLLERLQGTPVSDGDGQTKKRSSGQDVEHWSLCDGLAIKGWNELASGLAVRFRKRDPEITDTEATRRGFKTLFQLAAAWYADVLHVQAGDGGRGDDDARGNESAGDTPSLFGAAAGKTEARARTGPPMILNAAQKDALEEAAQRMERRAVTGAINRLAQAERQLDLNANTQLVVETLLNDLERIGGRAISVA